MTEQILGKTVTVTVDRPIGSVHPKHKDIFYPVNYGYVKGVIAGDGEEQDAYILGIDKAVTEYTGKIIAIINRQDDIEDKWVVVPYEMIIYEPDIRAAVHFQEQYFQSDYKCLYEKSCGAVMYIIKDSITFYLLLRSMDGHYGFPKGHIEHGESEQQTALREVFEETGLEPSFVEGFRECNNYICYNIIKKQVVYLLAEFNSDTIAIQEEEICEYRLLQYNEARQLLTFDDDKVILDKAEGWVTK